MQGGLDLPEEPTLPLTPSTYVRENRALDVVFLFLFNRLLHGRVIACFPAKVFVRMGVSVFYKLVSNRAIVTQRSSSLARRPLLETDSSYTFNC